MPIWFAGTFNAYDAEGALSAAAQTNGAAGSISLFFIAFAILFGLLQAPLPVQRLERGRIALACTVASLVLGMMMPLVLGKDAWLYITFIYIFFTAVLPMWLLKQPRDAMTTFMFAGMILGAVVASWWPTRR